MRLHRQRTEYHQGLSPTALNGSAGNGYTNGNLYNNQYSPNPQQVFYTSQSSSQACPSDFAISSQSSISDSTEHLYTIPHTHIHAGSSHHHLSNTSPTTTPPTGRNIVSQPPAYPSNNNYDQSVSTGGAYHPNALSSQHHALAVAPISGYSSAGASAPYTPSIQMGAVPSSSGGYPPDMRQIPIHGVVSSTVDDELVKKILSSYESAKMIINTQNNFLSTARQPFGEMVSKILINFIIRKKAYNF